MNRKNQMPTPGNVDLSQGMMLGGHEPPPQEIDLTKPIDDQLFRKVSLSLMSSIAESLGKIAFHAERALPLTVNSSTKMAEQVELLVGKLQAFGFMDEADLDAGEEAPDASTD